MILFADKQKISNTGKPIRLRCYENPPVGVPFYTAEICSSSMDLAWYLHELMAFPEWSSVLVNRQDNGRGQCGRDWISPSGNLYASVRLPIEPLRSFPLTHFLITCAIYKVLMNLGLSSEFKWPNDILVCRKKVGGVLIEEKSGVLIVGIGINLSESPGINALRDPKALPAAHLKSFGVLLNPFELWSSLIQQIMGHIRGFSHNPSCEKLLKTLEGCMAYMGEKVVFKTYDGKEFPAVVAGLSKTGGIRLETADGEKILHSGSLFPLVY